MSYDRSIPVEESLDVLWAQFIVGGFPKVNHLGVLAQNGARIGDIETYTLMSKIAATGKFVPFTDEAAVDGSAIPQFIYLGPTLLESDIQAGDIEGIIVLERDAEFREDWLIIENGKDLDTIITVGTTDLRTIRDHLMNLNLVPREVAFRTDFENPAT